MLRIAKEYDYGLWARRYGAAILGSHLIHHEACRIDMAPRFVEVSRPVEDGVAWAATVTDGLVAKLANITANATGEIWKRLESITNAAPEIKVYDDLRYWLDEAASSLPSAKQETKYMVLASVAFLVLRWLFVMLRSRSILANYGATKMMHKEE